MHCDSRNEFVSLSVCLRCPNEMNSKNGFAKHTKGNGIEIRGLTIELVSLTAAPAAYEMPIIEDMLKMISFSGDLAKRAPVFVGFLEKELMSHSTVKAK